MACWRLQPCAFHTCVSSANHRLHKKLAFSFIWCQIVPTTTSSKASAKASSVSNSEAICLCRACSLSYLTDSFYFLTLLAQPHPISPTTTNKFLSFHLSLWSGVHFYFFQLELLKLGHEITMWNSYLSCSHDLLGCIDRLLTAGTFLWASKLLGKLGWVGVGGRSVTLWPVQKDNI